VNGSSVLVSKQLLQYSSHSVFRIMKSLCFDPSDPAADVPAGGKAKAIVEHLKELDLVGSHNEVNLLWNQKAEEIKRGGAVDLRRKMTVGECERWAMIKKEQMTRMRAQLQARAREVGFVEGMREAPVKIPAQLRAFRSPMFVRCKDQLASHAVYTL